MTNPGNRPWLSEIPGLHQKQSQGACSAMAKARIRSAVTRTFAKRRAGVLGFERRVELVSRFLLWRHAHSTCTHHKVEGGRGGDLLNSIRCDAHSPRGDEISGTQPAKRLLAFALELERWEFVPTSGGGAVGMSHRSYVQEAPDVST